MSLEQEQEITARHFTVSELGPQELLLLSPWLSYVLIGKPEKPEWFTVGIASTVCVGCSLQSSYYSALWDSVPVKGGTEEERRVKRRRRFWDDFESLWSKKDLSTFSGTLTQERTIEACWNIMPVTTWLKMCIRVSQELWNWRFNFGRPQVLCIWV